MAKKFFSVTAIVSSLNKPAHTTHVRVPAKDEEDAEVQARTRIQRTEPNGTVRIGKARPIN